MSWCPRPRRAPPRSVPPRRRSGCYATLCVRRVDGIRRLQAPAGRARVGERGLCQGAPPRSPASALPGPPGPRQRQGIRVAFAPEFRGTPPKKLVRIHEERLMRKVLAGLLFLLVVSASVVPAQSAEKAAAASSDVNQFVFSTGDSGS